MDHDIYATKDNVRLRPLKQNDIELLRVWRNDNNNSSFLKPISYITPEMQQVWFEKYLEDPDIYTWSIDEISKLNRCVGSVSLYNFKADLFTVNANEYDLSIKKNEETSKGSACEFGRLMIGDTEARGKKIGFTATILSIDIAFNNLGAELVHLKVDKDNIPAYKIYREAGFS